MNTFVIVLVQSSSQLGQQDKDKGTTKTATTLFLTLGIHQGEEARAG
jgi:hypothetical protein